MLRTTEKLKKSYIREKSVLYFITSLIAHHDDNGLHQASTSISWTLRRKKKLAALSHRIMEHSSLRLWTISEDRQEFDRYKTLVDGSLKHSLTSAMLNEALPMAAKEFIGKGRHIAAVHDGSDIRKEHSQSLESLGKVQSLSGAIVNGYQTMNTILYRHPKQGITAFAEYAL